MLCMVSYYGVLLRFCIVGVMLCVMLWCHVVCHVVVLCCGDLLWCYVVVICCGAMLW